MRDLHITLTFASRLAVAFALVFTRVAAFVMALPTALGIGVPVSARLFLSVLLGGALVAAGVPMASEVSSLGVVPDGMRALLMIGGEISMGAALALIGALGAAAAMLAGQLFGLVSELSASELLANGEETNVIGGMFMTLAGFLFFVMGFHRPLLLGLGESYRAMPAGGAVLLSFGTIVGLLRWFFVSALFIAAPVFGVVFLLTLVQGVIARFTPQINVLLAAPPIVTLVAMGVLFFSAGTLVWRISRVWDRFLLNAIGVIAGGFRG